MERTPLDAARELCDLTGARDLLAYLDLKDGASAADARDALRARRRRLQGMQGNPKYKEEAVFLIRNFGLLESAVSDPSIHTTAMAKREVSANARVLESTLRSLLTAGDLSAQQETHLRRNAGELGIDNTAFEEMLTRLLDETGRQRTPNVPHPSPTARSLATRDALNHYQVLGVHQHATFEEVRRAYHARATEAGQYPDAADGEAFLARLDQAWEVLADPARRSTYDLAVGATGPPARLREAGAVDPRAATAPPVRSRTPNAARQKAPARLVVDGPSVREVEPDDVIELHVQNTGAIAVTAQVRSDVPWLRVSPATLLVGASATASVTVTVADRKAIGTVTDGVVSIAAGALQASVGFQVPSQQAELWRWGVAVLSGVVPVLVIAAVVVTMEVQRLQGEVEAEPLSGVLVVPELPPADDGGPAPAPSLELPRGALHVTVRPRAEAVLVNGVVVGSGEEVILAQPPLGTTQVIARHRNFRTLVQEVEVDEAGVDLDLALALERRLVFRPTPDLSRGTVSNRRAEAAVTSRADAIDDCLRADAPTGGFYTGTVVVHVDALGRAVGMELHGDRADEPAVRDCVERHAATLMLGDLADGDYATVRYDYTVSAGDDVP